VEGGAKATFGGKSSTKGVVSLSLRLRCTRFGSVDEVRNVHFVTTHMEEGCVGKSPQHSAMIALFGEDQKAFLDGRQKEVLRWEHTILKFQTEPWAKTLHSEPTMYFGDFNCRIVDTISQHGFGFVSPLARRTERYHFQWLPRAADADFDVKVLDALKRLYDKSPGFLFVPKARFIEIMQQLKPEASAAELEATQEELERFTGSSPKSGHELLQTWLKPLGLDFDQFLYQLQKEYKQYCEEDGAQDDHNSPGLMLHLEPELYWDDDEFKVSDMAKVAFDGKASVPIHTPGQSAVREVREHHLSELYCREHPDAPPLGLRETLRRVGLPSLEGHITFAPTYKHHGSNSSFPQERLVENGDPSRGGAWCTTHDYVNKRKTKEIRAVGFPDRIFFNASLDSIFTQLLYAKVPNDEDHDHVYSLFVL